MEEEVEEKVEDEGVENWIAEKEEEERAEAVLKEEEEGGDEGVDD